MVERAISGGRVSRSGDPKVFVELTAIASTAEPQI
jgi:hypothetical protein